MKKILSLALLLIATFCANAQMLDPVKFTSTLKTGNTSEGEIIFSGKIEKGWHVYSTGLGSDGPVSASFNVNKLDGVKLVGKLKPVGHEISNFDQMFGMNLRYFEHSVKFVQKVKFTKPNYTINAYLEFGACNDENCMPPTTVDIKKSGKSPAIDADAAAEAATAEAQDQTVAADTTAAADSTVAAAPIAVDNNQLWKPVVKELQAFGGTADIANHSLFYIFLMGLIGGLLALVMPCIWPIIPMTVSFFLKRAKDDKKKGVRDAVTYGISIVIIYLALGILVTAIFGPSKLNELSTNAVFNIFLFLLLVSFSCTAPIIGLLLVETVTSGNWISPAVGMLGFALALALPFTLFAMFPSLLKSAPRSGSWMNTIKVVLGFVELAFALKFFSVADLAYGWHLLDREVFLSLWIVIFGALGCWLKFRTDEIGGEIDRPMPVACIMLGLCSLAFMVYMIPGLWGAPCKAVSAFAPPVNTQDFNLNTKIVEAKYTNYEEGMAAAKAQGKPVLVDFTGFGCVNCRKMEASVWTDPQVADKLTKDYILISLFVDDKTKLAEPIEVEQNGQKRTLRTVGDKWSYLQSSKFGANAQPFYVAVDADGNPLTGSFSFKEDVPAYLDFLNKGLEAARK